MESNVKRSRAGEILGVFQELRVSQHDWSLGSKRESCGLDQRQDRHTGKAVGHGMIFQLCSKYKKALNNFKHKSNIIYTDGQQAHEKVLNISH